MRPVSSWLVGAIIGSAAIPAFALVLGGIAKLHDPFPAARFLARGFGLPPDGGFGLACAVAVLELLTGGAICLFLGRFRVPPYAAMCLLAFFVGLILQVARSAPNAASCGCFGSLMGEWIQRSLWTQVWIDVGLFVSLAAHLRLIRLSERRMRKSCE